MSDGVYDRHPELYDAINADWDYDRDCQFLRDAATRADTTPETLLEIGAGTGEHTRRLAGEYQVTAVEPARGAVERAREKIEHDADRGRLDPSDVSIHEGALPDLPVAGEYDLVVAIRGVVNHLAPDELDPALSALADRLAPEGLLVFDNSPLPADGNEPGLDDGSDRDPAYVRIAHHRAREDGRLDWQEVIFTGDDVIRNVRPMTPFDSERLVRALNDRFRTVELHSGYGPGDDRTVFVVRDPVADRV